MKEKEVHSVTIRFHEDLHRPARVKIADIDTTFQAVVNDLLTQWVKGERFLTPSEDFSSIPPPYSAIKDLTASELTLVKDFLKVIRGDEVYAKGLICNVQAWSRSIDAYAENLELKRLQDGSSSQRPEASGGSSDTDPGKDHSPRDGESKHRKTKRGA